MPANGSIHDGTFYPGQVLEWAQSRGERMSPNGPVYCSVSGGLIAARSLHTLPLSTWPEIMHSPWGASHSKDDLRCRVGAKGTTGLQVGPHPLIVARVLE